LRVPRQMPIIGSRHFLLVYHENVSALSTSRSGLCSRRRCAMLMTRRWTNCSGCSTRR